MKAARLDGVLLDYLAEETEREIVAAHPGIDVDSDEYLSLLAGEVIVDGMNAAECASVAAEEAKEIEMAEAKKQKRVRLKVCGHAKLKAHACPYKSEIHNDETKCHCCDDCQYQCAQDI